MPLELTNLQERINEAATTEVKKEVAVLVGDFVNKLRRLCYKDPYWYKIPVTANEIEVGKFLNLLTPLVEADATSKRQQEKTDRFLQKVETIQDQIDELQNQIQH